MINKIKYKNEFLTLQHYKEPLTKVKSGYGYYGCLLSTLDGSKIQCHICGKLFQSLVFHLPSAHDINTKDYRERFGLARLTALVSENMRKEMKQKSLNWISIMEKKHGKNWRLQLQEKGRRGAKLRPRLQPKEALETKNKKGTCPDQLLHKIKETEKEIGHVPSKEEFIKYCGSQRYVHLIYKTFGSWSNALRKLGFTPQTQSYDDSQLLEFLKIFYETNNKIPTHTDSKRGLIPPSSTYKNHFGSLVIAREMAGIFDKPVRIEVDKRKGQSIDDHYRGVSSVSWKK